MYACMHAKLLQLCDPMVIQGLFVTLRTVVCQAPLHGVSPGKNTGVNGHALLQGIFPSQGSNLCLSCLPHWQMGSLPTSTIWEAQTTYYRPEITIFLISSTILQNKCHVHFTEDKTETWSGEITSWQSTTLRFSLGCPHVCPLPGGAVESSLEGGCDGDSVLSQPRISKAS